jgi:hypothetical protein
LAQENPGNAEQGNQRIAEEIRFLDKWETWERPTMAAANWLVRSILSAN